MDAKKPDGPRSSVVGPGPTGEYDAIQPSGAHYGMQPGMQGYGPPGAQQQQQTTVIVMEQPKTSRGQPQNIREWSTGLCGCCEDIPSCCFGLLCPCIFSMRLASKMNENCCGPVCFCQLFIVPMRTKVRTQYGIRGSILNDIMTHIWCDPCSQCQMYRELQIMERV